MKFLTLLLPLALLFQSTQGANIVLPGDEDGDGSGLADLVGDLLCYIIPCDNDASFAWGNVLGAGSPSGAPLAANANNPDGTQAETPIRDSLQEAARNMFFDFMITQMTNQMNTNNNGGTRKLRGSHVEEKPASDFAKALAEKQANSL